MLPQKAKYINLWIFTTLVIYLNREHVFLSFYLLRRVELVSPNSDFDFSWNFFYVFFISHLFLKQQKIEVEEFLRFFVLFFDVCGALSE